MNEMNETVTHNFKKDGPHEPIETSFFTSSSNAKCRFVKYRFLRKHKTSTQRWINVYDASPTLCLSLESPFHDATIHAS